MDELLFKIIKFILKKRSFTQLKKNYIIHLKTNNLLGKNFTQDDILWFSPELQVERLWFLKNFYQKIPVYCGGQDL